MSALEDTSETRRFTEYLSYGLHQEKIFKKEKIIFQKQQNECLFFPQTEDNTPTQHELCNQIRAQLLRTEASLHQERSQRNFPGSTGVKTVLPLRGAGRGVQV